MISTILIILLIILYFDKVNKCYKLKEQLKAKEIPFDNYSSYIKSYVEFYKWLNESIKSRDHLQRYTLISCLTKFKELFKHCEND